MPLTTHTESQLYPTAPTAIENFMPHAICWYWDWRLILTHAIADISIAGAYIFIAFLIFWIYAKGRLADNQFAFPGLWVFGGWFVLLCGFSHLISFTEIWVGGYIYWFSGIEKMITATVSIIFVYLLWSYRSVLISYGQAMHIVDIAEHKSPIHTRDDA